MTTANSNISKVKKTYSSPSIVTLGKVSKLTLDIQGSKGPNPADAALGQDI
ncbi:MAG: hypothetical protein KA210_14715 [Bacteroidia bacterium]|jgi:hypothetical protein|nr:hypothetical protein [Pseudarcicella sp.]MBP6757392.1 hypothetical protein [Bacteroidia bacterium]